MTRILKYFFFKIYSSSLSNGVTDAGWAMSIVTMFVVANVFTLFDIFLIITKTKLPQISNFVLFAAGGLILYFNFVLLIKKGKAQIILNDFKKAETKKGLLNLFLVLYIILTIALFIYTGNIVRALNTH